MRLWRTPPPIDDRTSAENPGITTSIDWSGVEPSIFGTLLTRALDPRERHKLGAEYTPRSYVERLIRPTIIEPLRDEWDAVRFVKSMKKRPELVTLPLAA